MKNYSLTDKLLIQLNDALNTLFVSPTNAHQTRKNPAENAVDMVLDETERQQSESLMRVNHTGEICAQALYRGQLVSTRNAITRDMLRTSCEEETDHLAWTQHRLAELNGRTSYLNPLWYFNAFMIGVVAGLAGDRWSLGFIEETEYQVDRHLQSHLKKLPAKDLKSRAIVAQMREDELNHAKAAVNAGATSLPSVVKKLMQVHAKCMTTVAHYL